MGKRIVIALGGNALGKNLHEQMDAVHVTAKAIADLIEDGHEVVIAHGNGPQVGMIQNAFAAYHKQEAKSDIMPLSVCVAMSQGYIGYDLQNMIGEELDRRGLGIHCATVLTQVAVNPEDPAFQHPTKPIGAFMTEEEAKKLAAEKGIDVAEDAGRGWRQVVASPKPVKIVEIETVRALMNAKHAVIAAAGGEGDFSGLRADARCDGGSCRLQALFCLLADGVQARRVSEVLRHIRKHRFQRGAAHFGRRGIVCVNLHHRIDSFRVGSFL